MIDFFLKKNKQIFTHAKHTRYFIRLYWFYVLCLGGTATFLVLNLPIDFQQGSIYKLIFIHVPSAWMSIVLYTLLVVSSILYLVLKYNFLFFLSTFISKYGIFFSLITLITGSIWGKPLWGTYWVWDARLTSMLILLIIYISYSLLIHLLKKQHNFKEIGSIFAIFGFVCLPIIKYSVEWWTTLHQNASLNFSQVSFIHSSVYLIMLLIFLSFLSLVFLLILIDLKSKYIHLKLQIE